MFSIRRLSFSLSLFISILVHLFVLCFFILKFEPFQKNYYEHTVPAYASFYPTTLANMPAPKPFSSSIKNPVKEPEKHIKEKSSSIGMQRNNAIPQSSSSLMTNSLNWLKTQAMQQLGKQKGEEPLLMVGEINGSADPFVRLVAKALSAHFTYPQTEGMMGLKGRVLVKMTLHPQGDFTDVSIEVSSNNANFDAASMRAVNTAPLIPQVQKYIKQPKTFLVNFIFN